VPAKGLDDRIIFDLAGGFFGAFAKLRKAAVSFVMSACRPFAWNNSAPTGRIFMKFDI
jgi:hypothetical protein